MKKEKYLTLNISLPEALFGQVLSGEKREIRTKRNPRKDRYFLAKVPRFANIKSGGKYIIAEISSISESSEEWRVILGKIISTDGVECRHPPGRLYAWSGSDAHGPFTAVTCCLCGAVLSGAN